MTANTTDTASSSPSPQEVKDEMERRAATMAKAIARIKDWVEYMGVVDRAVAGVLPEFIAQHPLGEAVDTFCDLEDQIDALDKEFKSLKARIAFAREVSFPTRLDAEDTRTFTSKDSGHRVTRTARIFASIVSAKVEQAYAWLRANDLGPLIKETVNSSSLSAAAKELMENGRELPEDIFTVHTKDGISITKSKKG